MSHTSRGRDLTGAPALRHPGRWLWVLLLIPVAIGLARLRFDFEIFDLLPSDLPAVAGLKLYQEHFANARELVITIQGPNADETEEVAHAFAEALRRAPDLVQTATWQAPWLEHPEQSGELIGYLWFNQRPELFSELTNRLAPDKLAGTLNAAREELATSMSPQEIGRLSYDPYGMTRLPDTTASAAPGFGQGQEMFSSADGSFRIVFVQARGELQTYRECARWLAGVQKIVNDELVKRSLKPNEISVGYTGRPAFVTEIAKGMEQDITKSVGGTAVIIALLFWLAHRRVKPMLWLLTLLAIILASTLALGSLVFGKINVVSMGFAAILLGLAVDYAVVHYQEALAHPNLTIPQIRRAIAPSIFWAAVTTISAFLVLNFGGLPGLAQLGTLVGLGVALAALIMIFEFLPPLFPERNRPALQASVTNVSPTQQVADQRPTPPRSKIAFGITVGIVIVAAAVLCSGLPKIDATAGPLRPRGSASYEALQKVQALLSQQREPLWVLINAKTVGEVGHRLEQVETVLSNAMPEGAIAGFSLPTTLWPRPKYQQTNRAVAKQLSSQASMLRQAALTNGFTEQSLVLTERILATWSVAAASQPPFWPTNPMSSWIFEKVSARTATTYLALGMVTAATNAPPSALESGLSRLQGSLPENTWLSGWELLGSSIFNRVKSNLWRVLTPMVSLVLLSLYLAFRRPAEILLSLMALGLGGLCLLSVMRLAGWSWNLLNLMALPLVLGTGVDYSIFMQLALKRHGGDVHKAYWSVGRALLLCGGTAVAGFGSLAWSSNAGMASLGQLCAVGIGSNMLIAIFLLPVWWQYVSKRGSPERQSGSSINGSLPSKPSTLYRAGLWRVGLVLAKAMPRSVTIILGYALGNLYRAIASHRRAVVRQNIAPALQNDEVALRKTTRSLFRQFARKLIDLWRYEAGLDISNLLGNATGWQHFKEAQAQRRGILLLTPHLGNWEFGGPMLTSRGVSLQVLTLAEPGTDFTQLRQTSRARWNIETLVVGGDPLAFVEIIKRLEAGATVALLIDRPPPPSAVTVELFGRPFQASVAAAELARASGCALLPVYIPWEPSGYSAHMLPAIPYDRATLRDRAARQALTQKIVTIFEPVIRQYIDQWYHFVPLWANSSAEKKSAA